MLDVPQSQSGRLGREKTLIPGGIRSQPDYPDYAMSAPFDAMVYILI